MVLSNIPEDEEQSEKVSKTLHSCWKRHGNGLICWEKWEFQSNRRG